MKRKVIDVPKIFEKNEILDFTWNICTSFEMRIHELKAYKTANGHCDVPTTGKDVPLGKWCSEP